MTPGTLMAMALSLLILSAAFGAGFGLVALVRLIPWRWLRHVIGWPVGVIVALILNAIGYAQAGHANPALAVAFIIGAASAAFLSRRKV